MTTHTCPLGPIHLVLSAAIWQTMPARKERFARWPISPAELQADLQAFDRGVPTLVQRGRGEHEGQVQILMCTPAYYFLAVPSKYNEGYFVPWMEPLSLHQHERLARGALLLKATRWHVHTGYGTIPQGSNNNLAQILRAWQALQSQVAAVSPPTYTITPVHESYLNTVSKLIDVTRQLVLDRAALAPPIGYREVESAGEVRHTTRDIYIFHLVQRTPRLNQGDFLRLRDAPDLRGRVLSLEGKRLTVKFEGPVDRARIPEQGVFERTESTKPFRLQQEAIEVLRAGEAKNPHLLQILVDGVYQPYSPASLQPSLNLNAAQVEAFRRSLTVPDLLLVLGPPGTGKTRTIAEIVGQHGMDHRRVLVTAKTHKAVDNVLERLPAELTVVRIGHEDRVSENTRHLLIDAQARELQAILLRRTEAHAQALSNLVPHTEEIEHQGGRLSELIAALEKAEVQLQAAQRELETTEKHIRALYGNEMRRLRTSLEKQTVRLDRIDRTLKRLAQRRATAEAKRHTPLLGLFWTWWSSHLARRIDKHHAERRHAQTAYDADARAYIQAQKALRRAFRTPEYHRLKDRVSEAIQVYRAAARAALDAAQWIDRTVAGLVQSRPPLELFNSASLRHYLIWFQEVVPLLQRRHVILSDWRTRLESRTEELYPILIRFADVVGATCIGIATDPNFENVDFDLAIADEAGQIGLPDLLVPLVRAKRAMLVGDHHQLPPFVENEVQAWLKQVTPEVLPDLAWVDEETTEAEVVTGMLTQSVFESLFPTAEPNHVVRFNQQYRMPQAVADFAAQCFYDGQLETTNDDKVYGARHPDPLFKKPLVFVDTSVLPPGQRKDSPPGQDKSDPEAWGMPGYVNRLEAALIADIAAVYNRAGLDWVVIVPYRAQARRIRHELARRLPAAPDLNLDERVATVDSFQGGECDRVIYGFTRSNHERKVGFLRELRRLNVAMTRARKQLVLVGDAATLTQARNTPFRNMAQALQAHVQRTGELLSYDECQARLTSKR